MLKCMIIAALLVGASPALAQEVAVPTGLKIVLQEVRLEQEPVALARFRFVAPAIKGGALAFADVVEDIEFLCQNVVVPALAVNDWTGSSIVISVAEVAVPFGDPASNITQYFQPYTLKDGACQWEPF